MARTRTYNNVFVLYTNLMIFFIPIVISLRSLTPDKSIKYNDYLDSETGKFQAGFSSMGDSQDIYFCIWYKNPNQRTIVWVANRDIPLQNSTGVFKLTDTGNPVIVDGSGNNIWFLNASAVVENPFLLLLDTGNIVVRNGSVNDVWWQSFDYPSDTLLPGMILQTNRISGAHNSLTSWKNTGDPGTDYADGCVRKVKLDCDDRDRFVKYTKKKLPDTSSSWFDEKMNLMECEKQCRKNCTCIAYASLNIENGGSGCIIWFNNIIDMKTEISVGQEIYIRMAASELGSSTNNTKKKMLLVILIGIGALFFSITTIGYVIFLKRKKLQKSGRDTTINHQDNMNYEMESIDILTFDFSTITNATDHFSRVYKLGEGGYGPVYKGVLANGREIAVKRLSIKSAQGSQEFQNEVLLIANLQHRNLVKLIGCCIHNDERILIYEYMPNRSLDNFIFDQTKSQVLNWNARFHIISGIARGLLYLHQDSRVRIIHRDLKTSNILLDNDMNPKISDFGLARAFGGDRAEANTVRIVGTHGYMPPEYAVYGYFSVKSDVFSFGVIVMEIISGRKSRDFFNPQHNLNLIGHAWRLWSEDKQLEMIDESLKDSVVMDEALKCIQIGLLCVQDRANDRPEMSSVVLMLNGERALPSPRKPGFYPHEIVSTLNKEEFSSTNEISISILHPR
ncbi:unnamed protein product [Vicia faba]|uniref:non-specific serine/threonine protein kinase n=1 Tax=Vicia faba TaxID=3906 RepID=A0AAV1ADI9_VICFA|nr:unnamed protein product [Vicia faba]